MRDAASFHVPGLPALLIILIVLGLIVVGVASVVKKIGSN